jgi:hypothetical protein
VLIFNTLRGKTATFRMADAVIEAAIRSFAGDA